LARKTKTRERLITTAADLFLRQGYAQTGVNEIMQQAHATSGSFYHFFPTKEDLLLAVLDHFGEVLEDEIFDPAARDSTDPIERIFAVLGHYRNFLENNDFALGSPLGTLAAELSDSHPQVRPKLVGLLALWSSRIEDFLNQAADRFPADIDRATLAQFVLSIMEGAVIQARASRSLAPYDASIAQLKNHFDLLNKKIGMAATLRASKTMASRPNQRPVDWRSW